MLDQLCDQLFEKSTGPSPVLGRIIWCPTGNLEEVPRVLDVERNSPTDHYATKFYIRQMGPGHFRDREKLPVKQLALQSNEELLISKAKLRPCVVVSSPNTEFPDHATVAAIAKKRHLWDGAVLLAPMYGVQGSNDAYGFPPVMVARIKALLYNQFLHIPAKCPKTGLTIKKESIVRLDRLFSAVPSARGVRMEDLRLADEPLHLMLALMRERMIGEVSEDLQAFRDILRDTLPSEAIPGGQASG